MWDLKADPALCFDLSKKAEKKLRDTFGIAQFSVWERAGLYAGGQLFGYGLFRLDFLDELCHSVTQRIALLRQVLGQLLGCLKHVGGGSAHAL